MTRGGYAQRGTDNWRGALTPARESCFAPATNDAAGAQGAPSPDEVVSSALAMLERESQAWLQAGGLRADAAVSECDTATSESR